MDSKDLLKGNSVLICSAASDLNFNILKGLAMYLQASGCEVRWYTSDIFKEQLKDISIKHYPFKKAKKLNALAGSEIPPEKETIFEPNDQSGCDLVDHFKEVRPGFYEDIKDIYQLYPFDFIITDCGFSAAPFANKRMNIPVLTVASMPLKEALPVWLPMAPAYIMQNMTINKAAAET